MFTVEQRWGRAQFLLFAVTNYCIPKHEMETLILLANDADSDAAKLKCSSYFSENRSMQTFTVWKVFTWRALSTRQYQHLYDLYSALFPLPFCLHVLPLSASRKDWQWKQQSNSCNYLQSVDNQGMAEWLLTHKHGIQKRHQGDAKSLEKKRKWLWCLIQNQPERLWKLRKIWNKAAADESINQSSVKPSVCDIHDYFFI